MRSWTSRTVLGPCSQSKRRISSSAGVGRGGGVIGQPYYEGFRCVNDNLRTNIWRPGGGRGRPAPPPGARGNSLRQVIDGIGKLERAPRVAADEIALLV